MRSKMFRIMSKHGELIGDLYIDGGEPLYNYKDDLENCDICRINCTRVHLVLPGMTITEVNTEHFADNVAKYDPRTTPGTNERTTRRTEGNA